MNASPYQPGIARGERLLDIPGTLDSACSAWYPEFRKSGVNFTDNARP